MKSCRVMFALLLVLTAAVTANAFDYERKGFVIGVGAGYAPLMTGSTDEGTLILDDKAGLGANFIVGYAWNNRDMILYLTDAGIYEDTVNVYCGGILVHQNEINFSQGFGGLAFRHYLSDSAPSAFVTAGVGLQLWLPNERFSCHRGVGFLVGAGYEFVKHFQVSGSYSFGFTQNSYDTEYRHSQIVFVLTGLLY